MNCYYVLFIVFFQYVTSRPKESDATINFIKLFVNGKPFTGDVNSKTDNKINDIKSTKELNKENRDKESEVQDGGKFRRPTDKMKTLTNNTRRIQISKEEEENYGESVHVFKAYVPISEDLNVPEGLHGIILVDVNKDGLAFFGMN